MGFIDSMVHSRVLGFTKHLVHGSNGFQTENGFHTGVLDFNPFLVHNALMGFIDILVHIICVGFKNILVHNPDLNFTGLLV